MKDRERISRLLGAALNECSGKELESVRIHVLRAMNALDSHSRKKKAEPTPAVKNPVVPMTQEERNQALASIQNMIDEEASKMNRSLGGEETIFG
jgi:hypothetical protein